MCRRRRFPRGLWADPTAVCVGGRRDVEPFIRLLHVHRLTVQRLRLPVRRFRFFHFKIPSQLSVVRQCSFREASSDFVAFNHSNKFVTNEFTLERIAESSKN